MDTIIAQIRTLALTADEPGRASIYNDLRSLLPDLLSPMDMIMDLFNSHLRVAIVMLGMNSGLFRKLALHDSVRTPSELAKDLRVDVRLLERILRYLAANGMIEETTVGHFQAKRTTKMLADKRSEAFVLYAFETCGPASQAVPGFFADNNYADITDNKNTPFQKAFQTDVTCFEWLAKHPKLFDALQQVMTGLKSTDWFLNFDLFQQEAHRAASSQVHLGEDIFFVDVGGGHGHQCIQLIDKYPHLPGRLVLQDLPEAVNHLPPLDGVRVMAHDIFQPQTIKGARFYYLRRILHDYPDSQCIQILQHLATAMESGSRILVDEIVLPDVEAPWQATLADVSLMISLGGKERTKKQWMELANRVGLCIEEIHTYDMESSTSIIVLRRV
ncbi:S-adenosyl-L-methionine-dependent methyltransferase [Aspergillus phoenicis ATCC 13157]|uniref:S-adenosyl-L-methionine-dependent methyltransferase n=1 Tax=Aspergillus phoenicis ATCC 13157 TaxID=1353007 RepID=A0A370P5L5_ASPPH|nr:S-adenosyl-L-methionine-dependent methyltransferase [Aspergillus phoenicis ATCC 13157]